MKYQLIIFVLLILLQIGCSEDTVEEVSTKTTNVLVEEVKKKSGTIYAEYPARFTPAVTKNYSFKMAGKVKQVFVEKGTIITPGQKLAQLEVEDIQAHKNIVQQEYDQTKEAFNEATVFYNRVLNSSRTGSVSDNELEKARLDLELKRAELIKAEYNMTIATNTYNDAVLVADMEASVNGVFVKKGEIVDTGYPVVSVTGKGMVAETHISLRDRKKITLENKAQMVIDNDTISAKIVELLESPEQYTAGYYTKLVPNESLHRQIFSGTNITVFFDLGEKAAFWIPIKSLMSDGIDYVFVVKSNRVVRKNVTIRNSYGFFVEVDGVSEGDFLITDGMQNVREGNQVNFRKK